MATNPKPHAIHESAPTTTATAGPGSKPKSLAAKLAEVVLSVSSVVKRGTNEHFGYDYATEADVLEAVRRGLAERQVIIVPRCVGTSVLERERQGKAPEYITTADMVLTIIDGESSDVIECPWKGCGQDTGDKGLYKALTGGNKYFLLKLFMIPTGDDPEKSTKTRKDRSGEPEAPAAALDPNSDAVVILSLAAAIGKATGQKPKDVIKAFSTFMGKDKNDPTKQREVFFTDPVKYATSNPNWLTTTRNKLEIENRKLAGSEPGAAEGAALLTDGPGECPFCGAKHAPSAPCDVERLDGGK